MLEHVNATLKLYLDERGKQLRHFTYPVSREHYLQRCWPVIDRILTSKQKVTVIDAGCGHAYEAILFSALGAAVIGIDLREEGFRVAVENINYFRSMFPSLDLQLVNRDLFAAMNGLKADIIHVKQAFSHIHPAEKFVELAFRCLHPNGILVINDSNWLNPLEMVGVTTEHMRHKKLGWFVTDRFRDPVSQVIVPYAVERMMTPLTAKKMLLQSGFLVDAVDITGYVPVSIASKLPRLTLSLESVVKRIPIASHLGADYTITGRKPYLS